MRTLALWGVSLLHLLVLQQGPTLTPVNPGDITPPPTATFVPEYPGVLGQVASARFDASTYAPLIGEPFNLQLRVTLPQGAQLTQWPEFPEEWGPFQVVERADVTENLLPNDRIEYQQVVTVLLWRPGGIDTPETFVGYSFGGGDLFNVPVRSAFIAVPSVLDPDDLTLRPLQPPVDLPYISPWLVIGVLILAGAAGWFAVRWWRRRPKLTVEVVEQSPYARTVTALEALRAQSDLLPEAAYQRVADLLRAYIGDQLAVRAPDLTTDETLEELSPVLPETLLADLERILWRADMVKFAGTEPETRSVQNLVEYAKRWVEAVERQVTAAEEPAEQPPEAEGAAI